MWRRLKIQVASVTEAPRADDQGRKKLLHEWGTIFGRPNGSNNALYRQSLINYRVKIVTFIEASRSIIFLIVKNNPDIFPRPG